MSNYESSRISEGCYFYHTNLDQGADVPLSNSINKYVYVKQNPISHGEPKPVTSKVLVNPHFNKTVFVNPNFNVKSTSVGSVIPKIHVNPKIQKININLTDCTNIQNLVQKIHVNPNILRNVPTTLNNLTQTKNDTAETRTNFVPGNHAASKVFSTKPKLICLPVQMEKIESKPRKRRSSVRSKFKIIKSSILENSLPHRKIQKRRTSLRSKYKIIKSTCSSKNYSQMSSKVKFRANKFKVDNRSSSKKLVSPHKNRRYLYLSRFLSISDIAKNSLLKHTGGIKKSGLINISGILYKKSAHSLKRTSGPDKKTDEVKKSEQNRVSKSKFKFIRKSLNKKANEDTRILKSKTSSVTKIKKSLSPGKLRKCNIPCPYYRKFGKCKGNDNGKCYRKHDRDQIALCTKFLQGACVDKKCLLSHNVSPEKMPTCKFYLEGSCSRDDCPYLHVRISPKADICKDFLEGFCKKASQCDKRHQFLCPDYEKNGNCLKQRCPYPHGKMVRKYSVFNKNKFAKKSSDDYIKETKVYNRNNGGDLLNIRNIPSSEPESSKLNKTYEINVKSRYYIEQNITVREDQHQEITLNDQKNSNSNAISCDPECSVRSRPKLGRLPSFIAFEEL